MKIIYNTILPPPGFKAINLFGVLFARKGAVINEKTINHETIHTKQMQEMLYVFFYLWYAVEWLVRLVQWRNPHTAYRALKMEREAYANEYDLNYTKGRRRHYAWLFNY